MAGLFDDTGGTFLDTIIALVGIIALLALIETLFFSGELLTLKIIKPILIVSFVLLLISGGGLFVISRAEKFAEARDLLRRYRRLIRNAMWGKVDEVKARTGIHKKAWVKRRIPADRLPEILQENLVILFSITNYLKRMYIWNVKFGQVKTARRVSQQMYGWMDIHKDKDIKELEEEIYRCRNGGRIEEIDPTGARREIEVGVFRYTRDLCVKLNEISLFLSDYVGRIVAGMIPAEYAHFQSMANNLRTDLPAIATSVNRSYKALNERASAYGNHAPIRAQKYLVLDQCNPHGWHEHQYKFVRPGTLLSDGSRVPINTSLEVNQWNEVLLDKYNNTDRFYDPLSPPRPPRRVNVSEIAARKVKDLWPPAAMMDAIINDWEGFIRNMRYGSYRPNSKTVQDYLNALKVLGTYDFYREENIPITRGWKERANPAFDRRALVDSGLLEFVGRRNFQESYQDVTKNPKTDPYPAVSSYGMSMYIPALVIKDTEDIAAVNESLKAWVRDRGLPIESFKDVLPALGALYAEEKK